VPNIRRRRGQTAEPRDWALTWTLLFTAVLFLRPQDILPPLEALHLAELTAIAGLVSLFLGRLRRGLAPSRLTPDLVGVIALGAVILITAPFSVWMGGSLHVFTELYAKVILAYLLMVNVIWSPRRLERLTWVLVLVVGYVGFRAIIDYVRGANLVGHGTRVQGSVGGIMGNPNDLALNMVAFLPLAAFVVLRREVPTVRRCLAALCAFFMVGAIVASGSRGGFLGFVCMTLVMAAVSIRRHPGIVMGGALAVFLALPLLPASYWHRIDSIADESKDDFGSAQTRRTLLAESLRAFEENPVTGVGAGEFKDWDPEGRDQAWHEAHNVLLQVAAELGIAGLAVFVFLIGRAFSAVLQTRWRLRYATSLSPEDRSVLEGHSAAMLASLTGWFVCALFASVAYNWTFYYLLALAAAPREMLGDRTSRATVRARAKQNPLVAEASRA